MIKRKIKIALSLLILSGITVVSSVQAEDDFQYWSRLYLKIINGEKVDFNFYSEGWFRQDASRLEVYLLSPRIIYAAHKNLNLGLNYTNLGFRGPNTKEFRYQHRAEGEINPYWKFSNGVKITTRNRFEFRWIEDRGSNNTRMRNRIRLTVPTKGAGPLTSIFADTEFFYLFKFDQHSEQRTTPIGVNFKVMDQMNFQAFWMIQNLKTGSDWKSNQILGTMLTYAF